MATKKLKPIHADTVFGLIKKGVCKRKDIGEALGLDPLSADMQRLDVALKAHPELKRTGRGMYSMKHDVSKTSVKAKARTKAATKPVEKVRTVKVEAPAPSVMLETAVTEIAGPRVRIPRAQKAAWREDWPKIAKIVVENRFYGFAGAPVTLLEFMKAQKEYYGEAREGMIIDIKNKKDLEGFSPCLVEAQRKLADELTVPPEPVIILTGGDGENENLSLKNASDADLWNEIQTRIPRLLAGQAAQPSAATTEALTTRASAGVSAQTPKHLRPIVLVLGCYNEVPTRVLADTTVRPYLAHIQLKFEPIGKHKVSLVNVIAVIRRPVKLPPMQVHALREFHHLGGKSYEAHGEKGVIDTIREVGEGVKAGTNGSVVVPVQ